MSHDLYRAPGSINPDGVLPQPQQGGTPAPVWYSTPFRLQFTDVSATDPDVQFTSSWGSPIFDFHPNLRGVTQNATNASYAAIPIWRLPQRNTPMNFFLQITWPSTVVPFAGLRARAFDWAHVNDVKQIVGVSPPQDITAALTNTGTTSTVITFAPIGGAAPIKYWQIRFTFDVLKSFSVVTPPLLTVLAGMY